MLTDEQWRHWIVAVVPGDLGQSVAVAAARQIIAERRGRRVTDDATVLYLELAPAGTALPAVAERVGGLLSSLDAQEGAEGGVALLVDTARLGNGLAALLVAAGKPHQRVEVTTGAREGCDAHGVLLLPRRDLAAELHVAQDAGKFKVTPKLELEPRLRQAMAAFKVRPEIQADAFDAVRTAADDALVLAVALLAWQAGRAVPGRRGATLDPRRSGLGDYDPHAAPDRW